MKTVTVFGYVILQSGVQIAGPYRDFADAKAEFNRRQDQNELFLTIKQVAMEVETGE